MAAPAADLQLPLIHGRIGAVLLHTLVPGADQLAAHGELLHPVGAPAGDTGHGEQGRVQLDRKSVV